MRRNFPICPKHHIKYRYFSVGGAPAGMRCSACLAEEDKLDKSVIMTGSHRTISSGFVIKVSRHHSPGWVEYRCPKHYIKITKYRDFPQFDNKCPTCMLELIAEHVDMEKLIPT
jgi:hypothetical protein